MREALKTFRSTSTASVSKRGNRHDDGSSAKLVQLRGPPIHRQVGEWAIPLIGQRRDSRCQLSSTLFREALASASMT